MAWDQTMAYEDGWGWLAVGRPTHSCMVLMIIPAKAILLYGPDDCPSESNSPKQKRKGNKWLHSGGEKIVVTLFSGKIVDKSLNNVSSVPSIKKKKG